MSDFYSGTEPPHPSAPSPAPLSAAEFTAGILQATLNTRKVQAICALAWAGPQIDAYTVSLGLGERPESVEALAGALALAAGAEPGWRPAAPRAAKGAGSAPAVEGGPARNASARRPTAWRCAADNRE